MIPKKQMEDKQLNFNQPLLSIRRASSTNPPSEVINRKNTNICSPCLPPLPFYKCELKSGPVRNPGVVPFKWEQTAGKPKTESKKDTPEKLPLAPKLPPGRLENKVLKDSPGSSSRGFSSVDKVLFELVAEDLEKEKEMYSENEDENENVSSSEDENVNYVDAQDSLFLNCSLSGVSGLDGANLKPSISDPQIRDFMIGRFLPDAKAVVSETPQFASKKHPVVKSKESEICYDVHNMSLGNIYEDDEEEDEHEGHEEMSAKLCGLLPKFCILNPIPGLKGHARIIPQVRSTRTKRAYREGSVKNENTDRTGNHQGEVKNITSKNGYTNKLSSNSNFGRKCNTRSKEGSPQSLFLGRDSSKTNIQKKGFPRFKELLEEHYVSEGINSDSNPIPEKTLYIDSEKMASESQNSNSSSSESRGRTPSVDYSLQDTHSPFPAEKSIAPFELAPPLPKSPSESWLSRTLPAMSSKTYVGNPGFKASPSDSKRGKMLFHTTAELAPILEN